MMLKVASCDSQGSVYLDADAVYRSVFAAHAGYVREVLRIVDGGIDGVIETTVCDAAELPAELKSDGTRLLLKHRRVPYISYPHEWCATMLQDAALFHLELSQTLRERGLALKDAHPWNVLFDKGRPVFVDFTSLTTESGLFAESYLDANKRFRDAPTERRTAMLVHEIYHRMFLPYFIKPLLFYATGKRAQVRSRIEETTLNASTSVIGLRECLPECHVGRSTIKRILTFVKLRKAVRKAFSNLESTANVGRFYDDLRSCIHRLPVALGGSAYSAYYAEKGEDQDLSYSDAWNAKQKSVHAALNSSDITSVLDVACNTGWFALMAARLGKRVVAFDIDEGCIETLYARVRGAGADVLPLVMSFTQLTKDRYSIHDGNKVLISATERLRSDSVIALGIIHHLVLGLGLSFTQVVDALIPLCVKQLIIEFVDCGDAMIQDEPSFFPAYFADRSLVSGYEVSTLIALLETRGFEVSVLASHPSTRKILVCKRQAPA